MSTWHVLQTSDRFNTQASVSCIFAAIIIIIILNSSSAMHAELSVALNFIISHLYNKLPRRRVDVFREELQRGFELRFAGHWYPDDPTKGSGFRCVKLAADKVCYCSVILLIRSVLSIVYETGQPPSDCSSLLSTHDFHTSYTE